jgi:hypothetical protein
MPTGFIKILGGTTERRGVLRKAAVWILPYLVGSRLAANLRVTIRLFAGIEKERIKGDCEWIDTNIRPREFMIRIGSTLSPRMQLLTLAHELVHVKQYARGEMFDCANGGELTRWKRTLIDTDLMAYRDIPWEREALKLERPILSAYRASQHE